MEGAAVRVSLEEAGLQVLEGAASSVAVLELVSLQGAAAGCWCQSGELACQSYRGCCSLLTQGAPVMRCCRFRVIDRLIG